ncbi:tubulin binding cofactor C-domain-containing protein [Hysterangium stoloniferum]|nr:tubulin binding cofactor C-domain-containing protein [Hysterangium stoloniferum]
MDELGPQIGVHATDLSAKFYSHFQDNKNGAKNKISKGTYLQALPDISSRLESLRTSSLTYDATSPEFIAISSRIVDLRKDLIDATYYLPPYDRGKCEEQLKTLEESILQLRPVKPKFSFKRKPVESSSGSSISTRTNTQPPVSAPPPHLPDANPTSNLFLADRTSEILGVSSLIGPGENTTFPDSSDVTLTDLRHCFVNFFPSKQTDDNPTISKMRFMITALHAKELNRVVLVIPPMEGSVLLHNVHNSVIIVGCRQFRIHDATNTNIFLYTQSSPTIERCNQLKFGPYPEVLRLTFPKSFIEATSHHTAVQDFDWIKPTPSPNWTIMESAPSYVEKILRVIDSELDQREFQIEQILEGIIPR